MTLDEKDLIVATITNAVHAGIDIYAETAKKVMDEKIDTHQKICQAGMPNMIAVAVKKAVNGDSKTNGERFSAWAMRNWHQILIVGSLFLILLSRFTSKPITAAEIQLIANQVKTVLAQPVENTK